MGYKTLTTILTSDADLDATLEAAVSLARHHDAHLDVCCLGVDSTHVSGFYAASSVTFYQEGLERTRAEAEKREARVRDRLRTADIRWGTDIAVVTPPWLGSYVGLRARFSDLMVLPRPYGRDRGVNDEAVIESSLFDGKAPVLILPKGIERLGGFERIVLAWNESDEALRAARRALPLLRTAELVSVAIIDPPAYGPEGGDPGGLLTKMLARHGVRAEVSVLARTMPTVAETLKRHVADTNAGLLVMGAYGHSRLREAILGGATRDMLEKSEIPVFLAH